MFSDQFLGQLSSDMRIAVYDVVRAARQELEETRSSDNWSAEKRYVAQLRGFIDAFELDWDVAESAPPQRAEDFKLYFEWFDHQIDYYCAKLRFSSFRRDADEFSEKVELSEDYRGQIHNYLLKIRRVLQAVALEERQRENILRKLNELSTEIDKSRSGLTRFTSAFIEITAAVGEGAESLEPAVKLMERVAALFGKAKKENDVNRELGFGETKLLKGPESAPEEDVQE